MSHLGYRRGFFAVLALALAGLATGLWGVQRLGGWRFLAHRLHTQSAWPTLTQRVSQLETLPIGPGGVVLLGDSHVAYGEWSELLPGLPTYNRGLPGAGVAQLRAFAKTLPLPQARAVVVQIGTNDLLFHRSDSVVAMLRRLLDTELALGRDGPLVLVCTLPGVNNEVRWTGIEPAAVAEVNATIRELDGWRGVRVIDVAGALGAGGGVLPAGDTDDGVHLRGDAYHKWASLVRSALADGTTLVR